MNKVSYYIQLVKPRLTALALFSGGVGFVAALPGDMSLPWLKLTHLMIALGFVGAASNIMNQAMEHKLDKQMDRTNERPIPMGYIQAGEAKVVSVVLLILGLIYLQVIFGQWVMLLAFATFFTYVALYTPMKTKTSLNTVVGAFPGALPALTGWVACDGDGFKGFILFSIIFLWQFPHFFSIAWIYKEDYKRAGYKMISLYDETGKQAVALIVVGTLGLFPLALLPYYIHHTGMIYFVGTFVANALFLTTALMLIKDRKKYMKMYFYASITWLPFVFILMMLDRV
ncbi:MAG: protoheme IX farnesyltransferase [Lentisphaeraceae bacterium]|nr:protoheme IX farnesyltransferase [Lentisphaeraceae bacterium]